MFSHLENHEQNGEHYGQDTTLEDLRSVLWQGKFLTE
jgi:hypothetical protein